MSQSVDKIKPSYRLFREDEYKENLAAKQNVVEERPDQAKMDEVFEWTTTKEYQELNFARESLTINPAKACQPLGAVLCALGFEKTLPYVHGSQGCVAYFRTYFNRHFKEPIACVSDSMAEDAAVFGGQKNMFDGLENAKALYKPEMIAVSTTCMAEVIGDDLNAFIGNSKKEGHIPQEFPTPFAHNPSFVGSHTTGWDNMFEGIQRYFTLNYMDDKEVGSNGTARPRRSRHPHPESDMPNVMIRKNDDGGLLFYVAKKDMEETIANVETDTADAWGGAVELTDGSRWYIDPISPPPSFPTTLRFKRGD